MTAPVIQFKRGALVNLPGLQAGEPGFTTDSYDFYIGLTSETSTNKFFGSHRYWTKETTSTGSGVNLVEGTSSGSGYITLKAPNSLSGVGTYTFPDTSTISDGYFLKVASDGTLSWDTVGGTNGTFSNPTLSGLTTVTGSFDNNANSDFSGITTFSNTTDNTLGDSNTGAVQIDGGVGIDKNLTVGSGLYVNDTATFNNVITPSTGDSSSAGIQWVSDPGGGSGDIAYIRYFIESGENTRLAISNQNDANDDIYLYTPEVNISDTLKVLGTTDNTLGNVDTGAVQIDGGVGVAKNLTVGGNLNVQGYSEFVGVATFKGGTINLGDSNTDNINVSGEFVSNLVPNTDNTYDLGIGTQRWRNANFSGVGTFATGAVASNIQIGVTNSNTIDTVSGNLTLNSAGGSTIIDDAVTIQNNLTVNGNVTVGGTTITLRGTDVYIENKDIILGYTTSVTPNDDTANHAGVAIASTEGTPLVSFSASGINTLSDTYKQLMWFKSGTLGFSTDAFAFNYGVAIGTTTVANGVRLAVGSGITMSDTSISATNVYANNIYGSITGTATTATRATTVDTTATSTNATYFVPFVDTLAGQDGETIRVGAGLSLNPSNGSVATRGILSVGVPGDLTSYIKAGGGSNAMYLYGNGDVSFQSKVIAYQIRSNDNPNALITLSGLDATFANNVNIAGIATVGTALSTPVVKTTTIQHSNGTQAATIDSSGNFTASQNLTVSGNLYVNGSTTQVNTSSMTVEDRTIELGQVDGSAPSAPTTWDLGVIFNYNSSGAKKSGVVWEHADARFKFGSQVTAGDGTDNDTPQITVSNYAAIEIGSLWVNDCAGQSQVINCSGGVRTLQNITIDCGTF